MSDPEVKKVQLHLPGLLKLLGEHLYADRRVALREMIQNAHDSCTRRRNEDLTVTRDPHAYEPRIDLKISATASTLTIIDNGSGLTSQEIDEFLSTIGRSYTAQLRDSLDLFDREQALALVGQFGLGLLSAFLVAERLVLVTRSFVPGSPCLRWESQGEETYTVETLADDDPAAREEPGSTFTLHLKTEGQFLTSRSTVAASVRLFADFLRVPIHLNNSTKPINVVDAPWHRSHLDPLAEGHEHSHDSEDLLDQYRTFIVRRFGPANEPLTIVPLKPVRVETGSGHEAVEIPLSGVLFVPPSTDVSIREFGDVIVYVRRMLITQEDKDLLPAWARFVRGIVDCPALKPTVSRESIRRDDTFHSIQEGLSEQLLSHFKRLAKDDPETWRAIVKGHRNVLTGWAVQRDEFFDAVADIVPFETSRGRLTLPEILEHTNNTLYYFVHKEGRTQVKLLYEARGLLVIDAHQFAEEAFLRSYVERHPEVRIEQLQPGSQTLFQPADDDPRRWRAIVDHFDARAITVKLARFEPTSLPALFVFPPGAERYQRARQALNQGEFTGSIADLIQDYLVQSDPNRENSRGTLHLNVDAPLLQRLRRLGPGHASFVPALDLMSVTARFFAGRVLSPEEASESFTLAGDALTALVMNTAGGGAGTPTTTGAPTRIDEPEDDELPLTTTTFAALGLSDEAAEQLVALYPSARLFLRAKQADVSRDTGLSFAIVKALQAEILRQSKAEPDR